MDLTNFEYESDQEDNDRQIYCGFAFLPGEYENIFSSDDDEVGDAIVPTVRCQCCAISLSMFLTCVPLLQRVLKGIRNNQINGSSHQVICIQASESRVPYCNRNSDSCMLVCELGVLGWIPSA